MTKKEKRILCDAYERWGRSLDTELWHVYKSYSRFKAVAMEKCKRLVSGMNGFGLRIVSHNTQIFTVGFMYYDNDKDLCFAYDTGYNLYGGKVDEFENVG